MGPYHVQRWAHPQYFVEKPQIRALESSVFEKSNNF